ncbi:hypothetical protein CC80DRAFT_589442 [Byssothecium circinans]|uniref:Uncharacterized protein n=1 Tax=Byssothecium circinans TaxID=147558 RepID=A0A6A5ULN9_9PLEO|nr:hypothetical protein CC80DRAFT_589442 [Byssothecium circinans]
MQMAKRPLVRMFLGFKGQYDEQVADSDRATTTTSDILYEASLNFYSLYTIGKVRLRWVDCLMRHLEFDRQNRILYIFRWPTFCATSILSQKGFPSVNLITAALFPSNAYSDHATNVLPVRALHQEIILSYRLLFGQSSMSRELFKKELSELKKTSEIDPFLVTLGTLSIDKGLLSRQKRKNFPSHLFPASNLNITKTLIASEVYSVRDDFPRLGNRLLLLQRYNMSQQPSRVRDLWRDRRNPLQWYTFWAVLWIGGITIVLSLLQLLASLAQAIIAARSPRK